MNYCEKKRNDNERTSRIDKLLELYVGLETLEEDTGMDTKVYKNKVEGELIFLFTKNNEGKHVEEAKIQLMKELNLINSNN